MRVLHWRRAAATVWSAVLLATGAVVVPAEAAAPAAECYTRNGYPAQAGTTDIGGRPPKYKFTNSPYIGGLYESCSNNITVYYGGYSTNTTYYLLNWNSDRTDWTSQRLRAGAHMQWTLDAPGRGYNFLVRACNDTRCTTWSPMIFVNAA
ncbi:MULTISPECIES: hypothetical protein [unclassified Streptomyces]|uniref:hypothetical protein n=1 Tax=unclassified Streptomyces TaxID=2593676 RepID=UPI003404B239